MGRSNKKVALVMALGAVTMLGACKKNDSASDTTMAASATTDSTAMANGSSTSTGATGAAATAGASNAAMTDADIFAVLHNANQGEVDAGKMAESKGTNPSVKSFARDMVADHGKMLSDGDALAKKLNVTPNMSNSTADSVKNANTQTASQLQGAAKGAAFDSAYVAAQVMGHQNTLDFIKKAEGMAGNADLKSALQQAEPKVAAHLKRIQDIQSSMGKK